MSDLYSSWNNVSRDEVATASKLWKTKEKVSRQNVMQLQSLRRYEQSRAEYKTWKLGDTKVFTMTYVQGPEEVSEGRSDIMFLQLFDDPDQFVADSEIDNFDDMVDEVVQTVVKEAEQEKVETFQVKGLTMQVNETLVTNNTETLVESTNTTQLNEKLVEIAPTIQKPTNLLFFIIGGFILLIVPILLVLWCLHKRNKTEKIEIKPLHKPLPDTAQSTEMLEVQDLESKDELEDNTKIQSLNRLEKTNRGSIDFSN